MPYVDDVLSDLEDRLTYLSFLNESRGHSNLRESEVLDNCRDDLSKLFDFMPSDQKPFLCKLSDLVNNKEYERATALLETLE